MPSELVAVAYDAHDPVRLARFWGALLGRAVEEDPRGPLLPGTATQVGLRFVSSATERTGPDRIHLHLTSDTPRHQQRTVERVLELGGRHLDVGQRPEEGHVVLGDPEGSSLCVIPAGNAFLDGCGPLGELACDGTREVGLFWSEVLGWPLVWDEGEETAVQSPAGGTKVAWGGPPLAPKAGRNRQRLELATDDLDAEVGRLRALGAIPLSPVAEGSVELADPDGNEVVLIGR